MTSHSQRQHQATRMSPLVESLVSGDRAGVGGILCNDSNGLCLVSKGNMNSDNESGVYTSLVRLASQLTPYQQASMNNENPPSPLITVETNSTSILVKEYDGHTVAIKVGRTDSSKPGDQTDE